MFMKHYAPNRCLYIKVAKLGTGVGSAEMSHLQNCILKIYLKRALGGGGVGLGGQDGCERRIKVLVKFQKIYIYLFFFFFLGGGGVGLRGQGGCERRSKVVGWGSGGGGGGGGGVRSGAGVGEVG